MKRVTYQVILSLIVSALFIVFVLSGIALTQSKSVLQSEVHKELFQTSNRYANQFSIELQKQENTVDLLTVAAANQFQVKNYQENRSNFLSSQELFGKLLADTMLAETDIQSLYITFNPDTSGGNDEIWYLRDGNGKPYQKKLDNSVSDWLVDDGGETDAYYFDAIRQGTKWSSVEYDKYLKTNSITYSRACKDSEGKLIGVLGVDIFVNHILETVNGIQLSEGGFAFLVDQNKSYLTGSVPQTEFNQMKSDGLLPFEEFQVKNHGSETTVHDGERYITSWASTSNGWTVLLVQEEAALLKPIGDMTRILVLMAAIMIIGVSLYSYYFFKKSLSPITREFEEKDIIMLHQSRQAKLGEMVGNIAHQWKQPLNALGINLSILWDDYHHDRMDEESLKEHLAKMRLSIKTMSNTMDDFSDFLKPSREKEFFNVASAMTNALELMQESIKINRITTYIDAVEGCTTFGYKNEFTQAAFNVLNNARDEIIMARPKKREIIIRVYPDKQEQDANRIIIDISNYGRQLSDMAQKNAFQPYFTTKEKEGGTGIGLYITKDIIETHMMGQIELFNYDEGVVCRIIIPGECKNE